MNAFRKVCNEVNDSWFGRKKDNPPLVVLIGMPGVGKTTFLHMLGHQQIDRFLHVGHFAVTCKDLDEMIGGVVNEDYHSYYRRMGWMKYAQRELEVVEEVIKVVERMKTECIPTTLLLAGGGGLVLNDLAMNKLKEAGAKFIWFKARKPLGIDRRSCVIDYKHWKTLYKERKGLYKKWADCSCNSPLVLKQGRRALDKLQKKYEKIYGVDL